MRRWITALVLVGVIASAGPVAALTAGSDVVVPAAARIPTAGWFTDMFILNPNSSQVSVTLYWLVRDQANSNPLSTSLTIGPGETVVLVDVISEELGIDERAEGAFRIVADMPVVVNSRIFNSDGAATFGQGFEGIPLEMATAAGDEAQVVGLTFNASFRSNVYGTAGPDGATVTFTLREPSGGNIATRNRTFDEWEPFLENVDSLFSNVNQFDDATLFVAVTQGSAVVGASKVDNASTDPTTLESTAECAGGGAASVDGTYQFALYDMVGYATGGNIVVSGDEVTAINGTYTNWDKIDGAGDPECPLLFLWGLGLTPADVDDFADGVTFSDSFTDSGTLTWTVEFTIDDGMALTGSVTAEGSGFSGQDAGCNGTFPALTLLGGKME